MDSCHYHPHVPSIIIRARKTHQEVDPIPRIYKYTMFALQWDPTQFKIDIHLQMHQETDGTLTYLKGHTVRKLVSLMKYMSLHIRQDRPNTQKQNLLYFISGNQLFKLT